MFNYKLVRFSIFLALTISQVQPHEAQGSSTCGGASGWSYSASSSSSSSSSSASASSSFSSSSSYSGSSSSSGSVSISSVCTQAKIPGECITANRMCQWCKQEDFSGQRCNTEELLIEQKCGEIDTVKSAATLDAANENNRFNHQAASARVRVGDSVIIPFRIKEPEIYPVDLYYLMDMSYSMQDDLQSVRSLASSIIQTLQDLTMGGEGSVQIGFGKFVDKVQSPMTQMTTYSLQHPYGEETVAPFLYENVIGLTPEASKFEEALSRLNVSGNLDPPEGALDAMLQAVQCKHIIGWRGNALRLLMIATESAYHYAGDGSAFLAGISKANDGNCHLDNDGKYVGAEDQDYPTVNQVQRALEEKSITPIFAIGNSYADLYKYVSENVFRGSTWGVLQGKSENVVQLVSDAYKKIAGKQEIVTGNPDEDVLCPGYVALLPSGMSRVISDDESVIEKLSSGSKVYYNMSLAANKNACAGESSCYIGNVEVKTRLYDDKLSVDTTVLGAFGCTLEVDVNSLSCSGQGSFSCGICACNPGWTGSICDIPITSRGCREEGALIDCNGQGQCNDQACVCDPGYKHNKGRIYGDFCQCNECLKTAGLVCSNHGSPVTKDCKCACECDAGYTNDDCGCTNATISCLGINGEICSGSGKCVCGACVCDEASGFGGPTCSDCTSNCPSCQVFQDCVQCKIHKTGPYNQTCDENCPITEYDDVSRVDTYSMTEENTENGDGTVLCAAIDTSDNCKFYYSYQVRPTGSVFVAEKDKRCKPSYSLLVILWCFLLFLLIALILLCCWRCCVYVIDREEERKYQISNVPGLIPLLPAMGPGTVVEFIKAKYLVRRSAKVAVIPVRRSFLNGVTKVMWRTYEGSSMDNELEVLGIGEEGTIMRKKQQSAQQVEQLVVHGKKGDTTIEIEALESRGPQGYSYGGTGGMAAADGAGAANGSQLAEMNGQHRSNAATLRYGTVDETSPLLERLSWGDGEVSFHDGDEFGNIEIPLLNDFSGKEASFWVELYGQEKGVALGLKRTKVVVIKDEEAGIIGFPKPSYVFKENDGFATVPVHRTVGMDGKISVTWFTRDITASSGKHYVGGRGVVEFNDAEVTKNVRIELIPDILYDENEKMFSIQLEDPKGGASLDLSNCMVTMLCDEECSLIQFPKNAYPFMENCGIAEIAVLRTRSTKGNSTVRWYTEDDTAIAGKDYEASEGTITFNNAQTESHIKVPIIDNDIFDESGRAFRVVLVDPSEGTKLANNIANISIIEDDEPGLFEFTKTSLVMRSKTQLGRLTVIRSLGTDGHIRVPWVIRQQGDNAISKELLAINGVLEFRNGEISKYLELNLSNISSTELMMFAVILQHPSGGGKLGAKNEATVTVFAAEDYGTVHFAQSQFDVTATAGVANLLVSRKGDVSSAAFVMCETSDRSAISGKHYQGGTISVVFDAGETVKEVGIPVYNDPNHKGQLQFAVCLRSTPGGPKTESPSEAVVGITCVAMAPARPVGLAPSGPSIVEFVKPKYLFRRSAKYAAIPIHRSTSDGSCLVEWRATSHDSSNDVAPLSKRSSSSSTSSSDVENNNDWGTGLVKFETGQESSMLELSLEEHEILEQQMSLNVMLVNAVWGDARSDEIQLGLRNTEVIILNDIDAGTLGFSKATFSFKESEGIVTILVHRLGGMDGKVSARWRTLEMSAKDGQDYVGGEGTVVFANNQISANVQVRLLQSDSDFQNNKEKDQEEKKFVIELDQFKGGAKSGIRKTTIFVVSDEDRSVIEFSKPSYPVIGNSATVKLPILRTGSLQKRVAVLWRTIDGTAVAGTDYRACQNLMILEAGETRGYAEVPLSGKATEAKSFTVALETAEDQIQFISVDEEPGKVTLGANKSATVAIVCSQERGIFEFSKPSFVFKTSSELGMVPIIRSGGTDGEATLHWKISSLDQVSPFEGVEDYITFRDGQVTANIEIELEGVPSDAFVVEIIRDDDGPNLGPTTQATVTIIGELESPIIELEKSKLVFDDVEIVEIPVLRKGNVSEATYVGWKTIDGSALNGKTFIGGTGNLVFDPDETEKKILIPVLMAPHDKAANFSVQLSDIRGSGQLGSLSQAEVTLEPVAKTTVEFLRKRYLFRQSQGSSLIPVRRSNADGVLALQWKTQVLADDQEEVKRSSSRSSSSTSSSSSSSDEEELKAQRSAVFTDAVQAIDWGSGTLAFEDGEHEASIELVLCREIAHRESNFRIELIDSYDRVNFAVPSTVVTVIRDKDPGMLGFASPRYDFTCSESQLVIPVHRSSGADGTVAVPWFTRDATAVGGVHYLPAEGNLVFNDSEVLRKIVVQMPKRVDYFDDDEVAFKLCLGEPTGGASLSVYEAHVVLRNDIVPAQVSFKAPRVKCAQSSGVLQVPVQRTQDLNGLVTLSWQAKGQPGKPKSHYEGTSGSLVFSDGEAERLVTMKLPPHVQENGMESFNIALEYPTSGRATLGENTQCAITIDNDITPGVFHLEKGKYAFQQSEGRDTIKVLRKDGTRGPVSIPWRILPISDNAPPSPMHDIHGTVEFEDGQSEADTTVIFPSDTDEDNESFSFLLLPPGGRAELDEPYRANLLLTNDLKCEVSFTKPTYNVRGDIDTLLIPVVRDGPKGRPATVDYKTRDGTAIDCTNYIGEDGTLEFAAGENKKDILVPIMNDPNGGKVNFSVELCNVTGASELGANVKAVVQIDNVTGHGRFEMASKEMAVRQTRKEARVLVLRKGGSKGIADIPWVGELTSQRTTIDSVPGKLYKDDYDNIEGTLQFDDGESEKEIIIPLAEKPQDCDVTELDITLLTPTLGGGVSLGDVTSTKVTIENDLDGGKIQFQSKVIEVFGTDGEVRIPVVRTGSSDHPCQVTWEATDDTAQHGKHYRAKKGSLAFIPNEARKEISIPIVNDPSGDVMYFNVSLGNVRGGAKLGEITKCQVLLDHVKEIRHAIEVQQQSSTGVHGEIEFDLPETEVNQSNEKVVLKIVRKSGMHGRVVVPWNIKTTSVKSPYKDLHGQETFKDGETVSHIEIETPTLPQTEEAEVFSVTLGKPTGGAMLSSVTKCSVTVLNDIIPGKISFSGERFTVKQSAKQIEIPVERTLRTKGRVRVPWRTVSDDPESIFSNLSGVETFEDGDEVSVIRICIPVQPRETEQDRFDIELTKPKASDVVLGDKHSCSVAVENDISSAQIAFHEESLDILQSKGKVKLPVTRTQSTNGRVILPWKVVPESPDSVYVGVVGETILEDGDGKGIVEIDLPQLPLSNPEEKVSVCLESPVGAPAQLADDAICDVFVTHDIGEGLIEMKAREVACNSDDGDAVITVVRKLGHEFPAEVSWFTEDDTAMMGHHFDAEHGRLKFKSGEIERNIHIPLVNDPTGETRIFYVKLGEVKGRDKAGDVTECKVKICSEAMPPNGVADFDADLSGPQTIRTTWLPSEEGAPVDGYKITYWCRPGTVKTVKLQKDDTEAILPDLQPNMSYQVNVCPFNDLGDGPTSETLVAETQPELRLSYHTPMQARTSEKIAMFSLKRNIKDFEDVVSWKIVKEIRKKKKSSDSSSSSSSSSSSGSPSTSDEGKDGSPVCVSSGVLEFPSGSEQLKVEFPLKQDMRYSSQVYRFLAQKRTPHEKETSAPERYLANIELNVVNDTGYPARVRRPLAASTSPFEATVSWETPALGGVVKGYKVIARTRGEPDVVANVGAEARKTTLTGLRPSTKYYIVVQPYNDVGDAKMSPSAEVTTQDELKVKFTERFYTFKTSDKVAVIPIKRHFTRGYAALNWNARWCKRSDQSDTSSSSSDSDSDEPRGREWASGSVAFPDGAETAEVRIPLQQATPPPVPRKRSFFWLHIDDPNKQKRLAAMRCKLVDDKARLVAPKNVRTVINNANCFTVAWKPQEAPVHEYLVSYKRAGSNEDPQRHTVPPTEHSLTIEGLVPESAYAIVVSALGDNGQQASSDVIGCKMPGKSPGPPNRLAFQVLSPTSLNCSWGEPAITNGLITGYEVFYKPTDEEIAKLQPPVVVRIPDGHFRSLLVENLRPNTAYLYVVRAQNKSGLGESREATMKIEQQVGSRPPSAIFLDEDNMKIVQEQIRLEEAQRQEKVRSRQASSVSSEGSLKDSTISVTRRQVPETTTEMATSTETKTRVTRYIHKDGQREPEVEIMEYDGRLSQDDLAKLAANSERIEVQVISYNTTKSRSTAGNTIDTGSTAGYISDGRGTSPTQNTSMVTYEQPEEYTNTDIRRDVSQDTQVFTDVQESKEGDTEVTTITKTYKTTTTERRLETTSGMKSIKVPTEGMHKPATH